MNHTARIAVLMMFFINGTISANWLARIPAIQSKFEFSEGQLGIVLVGVSLGVVANLLLIGGLISRFGSRKMTVIGGLIMCTGLPVIALAPNPIMLWIVLFFFGVGISTMDVAMNAQAVEVERRYEKPIMSSFHAAFSIGIFAGAGMSSGLVALDFGLLSHFVLVGILFAVLILVTMPRLVVIEGETGSDDPVFKLPQRALWPLGILAFCAAIGEGAMSDWSAVYLRDVVNTSAENAALGLAVFSLMMALGRAFGDTVSKRFDPVMIVRVGAVIACTGLVFAMISPSLITALIGFGAVGIGISITIPLAFSAAGNIPGIAPGTALAGVASIGYAGFLAGPPVIGLIAEGTSLRISMVLVALLVGSIFFSAGAMRKAETDTIHEAPTSL